MFFVSANHKFCNIQTVLSSGWNLKLSRKVVFSKHLILSLLNLHWNLLTSSYPWTKNRPLKNFEQWSFNLIFDCFSNIRAFGVPISMRKWNKLPIIQGFEGSHDAFNRTTEKVKLVFNLALWLLSFLYYFIVRNFRGKKISRFRDIFARSRNFNIFCQPRNFIPRISKNFLANREIYFHKILTLKTSKF